jgi:type II secretory pathway predicted ATPase ExeA
MDLILNILGKPVHESLKQRITVHYNYQGLSGQETADYVANSYLYYLLSIYIAGN